MDKEADRVIRGYLNHVEERLLYLPEDERCAILDNLRVQFYDALNARCGDAEPAHEDIYAVIAVMDPPEAFGEDRKQTRARGEMPLILWLTIVVLGVSILGKGD
jgi:hypothetical protein